MAKNNEKKTDKNSDSEKETALNIFGEYVKKLTAKQLGFLNVFIISNTGIKAQCFDKAGISRSTFHKWINTDENFEKCFKIAEKVCDDARYEFALSNIFQMVNKGTDTLSMGEVIKDAPLPAAAKIKALEIILKTTRVGKIALSNNIPEEQVEKPKKPSLDEILDRFEHKQAHSRGIEAIDEEKEDAGK